MKPSIDAPEALAAANAVLAAKGRSFHWARRLLGKTHAERATRLYGFCRHLDDLADESTFAADAREKLDAASLSIVTGVSADPVIRDGIRLMKECHISPEIALELIAGVRSDLDSVRVTDEAELCRYCYRVAGTVGVMMCGVLDVHSSVAHAHAVDLGIAMQLTNISRDIAEDAAADRRYLPASMIGELSPSELISPLEMVQPRLRESVETLLSLADQYYASGESGLSYLPLRARGGILVAARVYRAIGTRLRAADCAFWNGRVVVHDREKLALTAQALLSAPLRSAFWKFPSHHDASLHRALRGLPGVETRYAN
ncbi:MAG: phytoene/squalene synthase family protein [Akkermansiaceae bacterium]|nr:phytoene/squalene synthase family protein [Akkermansiaceae bacterium]